MKKLFSILSVAALIAAALAFTGCEKHAYSYSTNKFLNADTKEVIGTKMTIPVGTTVFIVAAQNNGKGAYLDGTYTATTSGENAAAILSAASGEHNGQDCIQVTGVAKGQATVNLKLDHDGFDLTKSVSVTVQ